MPDGKGKATGVPAFLIGIPLALATLAVVQTSSGTHHAGFLHHVYRMMAKSPAAGTIVTIVLFIVTQILVLYWKIRDDAVQKERIITGLFDEITRNVIEERSVRFDKDTIEYLKSRVEADKAYRPLIIAMFQDNFYRGIARDLPTIARDQLKAVNDFYFFMQQFRDVVDGIERPTFFLLSDEGRKGLFDDLLHVSKQFQQAGTEAKEALKQKATRRWLS